LSSWDWSELGIAGSGAVNRPIRGRTGWQQISPQWVWILRHRYPPYCRFTGNSPQTPLPCRYTPEFPCCRTIG